MPLRTYWLSVWSSTRQGFFSASSAGIAAISSMRLLVVAASPPLKFLLVLAVDQDRAPAAGPGIPGAGAVGVDDHGGVGHALGPLAAPVVAHAADAWWKRSLRKYSSGSFGLTSAPGGTLSQSTSRVSRKRSAAPRASSGSAASSAGESGRACVALQQRAALGDVEGMVGLEAPGVEADRDIVGERVGAGEVEVDQARKRVAEEEHVVREQVGVDHALRQAARPVLLEMRSSSAMVLRAAPAARCRRGPRPARRAAASLRPKARCAACCGKVGAGEMQPRQRRADRGAVPRVRPPDPHAVEEGDDRRRPAAQLAERLAARFFTGCGQVMPRAARCSIRPRKNGRSPAATRFS